MKHFAMIAAAALVWITGCTNIGPKTVPRDRFDYNTAISDSWKEQTLLNIVKLRYADMPLFVEVASVVSGYTLEGSVNLNGTASSKNAVQGDFLALGATGKYTDRPTITYSPITGEKFNQSFMTPIPPKLILFLTQSGWREEMIFPITVQAINGLRSRTAAGDSARAGDPEFYQSIALLQKIQDSGTVSMQVITEKGLKETTVIVFTRKNLSPEIVDAIKKFNTLMGLPPDTRKFDVTYGLIPQTDQSIAIQTRSMLQIMIMMATQIDVPPEHVKEGRTVPKSVLPGTSEKKLGGLIKIHSTRNKPDDAFVSVKYHDYWFWINDRDFTSKRTFTFLMILFSLTESGGKTALPLVTISSG